MGADSGGDSEKMSVESTWKLFACVTMSFLAYAVLRPLCCPQKMPPLPKPAEGPPVAIIKINPQRLAFKLFPPGQAHYICGPKKQPEKKKKKKSLNAKLKECVKALGVSNAIRDLANQAKSTCDVPSALVGTVDTDTSGPPPPPPPPQPPNNTLKVDTHLYLHPKDPQVFSARLPPPPPQASTTSHLNGGASIVNTLSRRVQLRRSQRMEEDDDDDEDEDDIDPCSSSKIKPPLHTSTVIELQDHHDDDHEDEPKRPSLRAKLKLLRASKSIRDSSSMNNVSKNPEVTLDVRKLGNHQIIHIS